MNGFVFLGCEKKKKPPFSGLGMLSHLRDDHLVSIKTPQNESLSFRASQRAVVVRGHWFRWQWMISKFSSLSRRCLTNALGP